MGWMAQARRLFGPAVIVACTGLAAGGSPGTARAGAGQSYSVPLADGYGLGDCMRSGSDCGRVMADSWCEAHGHAHAAAFGSSDDVTGAIKASDKVFQIAAGNIVIRCDD